MGPFVFATHGGRRFHGDPDCTALDAGRYLTGARYGVRTRLPSDVARVGYTACRWCVLPADALPLTGRTFGHEPTTELDPWRRPSTVCARCTEPGLWYGGITELRPAHVPWPCMSAVVLGLVPREVAA